MNVKRAQERSSSARQTGALMVAALFLASLLGCPRGGPVGRYTRYAMGGSFTGASPDVDRLGRHVVFASPQTGHGDIYLLDLRSGNTHQVTHSPSYEGDPAFSPDGRGIVFVREEPDGMAAHLWVTDLEGRRERRLTEGLFYDSSPAWSPDGKRLVFARASSGTHHNGLYMVDTGGLHLRQLWQDTKPTYEPVFSLDAAWVYYTREPGEVRAVRPDGSGDRHVATGWLPCPSPDGKAVAVILPEYHHGLGIAKADGSAVHSLYTSRS